MSSQASTGEGQSPVPLASVGQGHTAIAHLLGLRFTSERQQGAQKAAWTAGVEEYVMMASEK